MRLKPVRLCSFCTLHALSGLTLGMAGFVCCAFLMRAGTALFRQQAKVTFLYADAGRANFSAKSINTKRKYLLWKSNLDKWR